MADESETKCLMFMETTGSDPESAKKFLEAGDWNVQSALNLYFTDPNMFLAPPPQQVQEPVRAPINARFSTLAGPQNPLYQSRPAAPEPFRDYATEWTRGSRKDDRLAFKLANLFSPPDYVFNGTLEEACNKGMQEERWLLVNIQTSEEFSSHVLNRDIWKPGEKNQALVPVVRDRFVFCQRDQHSNFGLQFISTYKIMKVPCIAVLNPITRALALKIPLKQIPEVADVMGPILQFIERSPKPKIPGSNIDDAMQAEKVKEKPLVVRIGSKLAVLPDTGIRMFLPIYTAPNRHSDRMGNIICGEEFTVVEENDGWVRLESDGWLAISGKDAHKREDGTTFFVNVGDDTANSNPLDTSFSEPNSPVQKKPSRGGSSRGRSRGRGRGNLTPKSEPIPRTTIASTPSPASKSDPVSRLSSRGRGRGRGSKNTPSPQSSPSRRGRGSKNTPSPQSSLSGRGGSIRGGASRVTSGRGGASARGGMSPKKPSESKEANQRKPKLCATPRNPPQKSSPEAEHQEYLTDLQAAQLGARHIVEHLMSEKYNWMFPPTAYQRAWDLRRSDPKLRGIWSSFHYLGQAGKGICHVGCWGDRFNPDTIRLHFNKLKQTYPEIDFESGFLNSKFAKLFGVEPTTLT